MRVCVCACVCYRVCRVCVVCLCMCLSVSRACLSSSWFSFLIGNLSIAFLLTCSLFLTITLPILRAYLHRSLYITIFPFLISHSFVLSFQFWVKPTVQQAHSNFFRHSQSRTLTLTCTHRRTLVQRCRLSCVICCIIDHVGSSVLRACMSVSSPICTFACEFVRVFMRVCPFVVDYLCVCARAGVSFFSTSMCSYMCACVIVFHIL